MTGTSRHRQKTLVLLLFSKKRNGSKKELVVQKQGNRQERRHQYQVAIKNRANIIIMIMVMITIINFRKQSFADVLQNRCSEKFPKIHSKNLYQSLFFKKVVGLTRNFFKKETRTQVFSSEFCEVFKKLFFKEHFRQLLLNLSKINN